MKQTIEEAAEQHRIDARNDHYNWKREEEAFIAGAKSEAAKEFHTQGMYSEEDMRAFVTFYIKHQGKGDIKYLGKDLLEEWTKENKL